MTNLVLLTAITGAIGIMFAAGLAYFRINKSKKGNEEMERISKYIQKGAITFLRREYTYLGIFVLLVFIIFIFTFGLKVAISFILGALFSATAGIVGMLVATKSNVKTAQAALTGGLQKALTLAFSGGAVMGMTVVGLGLLGLSILYYLFKDPSIITGYGLGASTIALFARVGGGIFTKAADVGADLVGKIEAGIPEDDSRNPAVIADNVGDNVGDVAGMGAYLF